MTDVAYLGLTVDTRTVKGAVTDLDRFTRTSGHAEKATDAFAASARRLGVALAGAFSVRELARAADSYTQMTNGLVAMGASAESAARQLDLINGIASRTRAPLEATAQLYQRITVAAGELGASQQDILRFTENVGLALGASGQSAQSASGALLQLSQAMAGGTVRAEEFNSILEGAYPIALAAAKGIDEAGGSVGRLRQMVVDGEVSSREFFDAVLSQSDELAAAFSNTNATIGQAFGRLGDEFTIMIGKANAATGATGAVAGLILSLADNLQEAAVYVASFAGVWAATLVPSIYAAVTAFVTLRGAMIATGIGAVAVAVGTLVNIIIKATETAGSFSEGMTLLGEIVSGVFDGMVTASRAIPPALAGSWQSMKSGFLGALADMLDGWGSFIDAVSIGAGVIPGFDAMAGLSKAAFGGAAGSLRQGASGAAAAAAGYYQTASQIASQGFNDVSASVARLNGVAEDASTQSVELGDVLSEVTNPALAETGSAAAAAAKQLTEAEKDAKKFTDTMTGYFTDGIGRAVDWMVGGFEGGLKSIWSMFTDTIKQMIAFALKNRIMVSMGLGGSVLGTSASAGGFLSNLAGGSGGLGGMLGSVIGGIGSTIGNIGSAVTTALGLGGTFTGSFGAGLAASMTGGIAGGASAFGTGLGMIGAGGGAGLAGASMALGAALPVIGLLAGLIGSKKKTGSGIQGTVTDSGLESLYNYTDWQKSRFFGLSKSNYTTTSGASDELTAMFGGAVSSTQSSVMQMARILGVGADVFDGFTYSFKTSLAGLSESEVQKALEGELSNLGDAFAALIPNISNMEELADAVQVVTDNFNAMLNATAFRSLQEEQFARSALGYTYSASDLSTSSGLLSQILTAIRSGNINTARLLSDQLDTTRRDQIGSDVTA